MPTVAVLAEQLIVGLQSLLWVYLGVALFLGADWFDFTLLERAEGAAALAIGSAAYTLGVLIDRISDSASVNVARWTGRAVRQMARRVGPRLAGLGRRLSRMGTFLHRQILGWDVAAGADLAKPPERDFAMMRVRVLARGGEIAAYLSYMRSRLRIARATVFNATLVAVLLLAHVAHRHSVPLAHDVVVTGLGMSLLVAVAASWVTRRIGLTYDKRLEQAHRVLDEAVH